MFRRPFLLVPIASLVSCSFLGQNSEADSAARRFLDKEFSKCGQSYLGVLTTGRFGTEFSEIRGLSISVEANNLSEADRLNGCRVERPDRNNV